MAATTGTRTTTASSTSSVGKTNLLIPHSASEFHALMDQMRAHHSSLHGNTADIAAYLKANLPAEIQRRGAATRGLMGLDARMMAQRIVKPLQEAAKLNQESAKLWVVSWTRFTEYVTNKPTGASAGFDSER